MLCVLPVSSHDAHLIPFFSKALARCGPNPLHQALIVARPADTEHAQTLFANCEGIFGAVEVFILPQDGPSGWPQGPNHYFSSIIIHLQNIKNTQPWLMCELDCTPLKTGWLDSLETEYNMVSEKFPFVGVLEKTHAINNDGDPVEAGRHMVGAGIYPPNISSFSQLWVFVPRMNKPYDVMLQWEIAPNTHHTKLIQHCFRTESYTRTGEVIQGEDKNGFPNGIVFNQPLSPEAVLHHGCTDGSLADIFIETPCAISKEEAVKLLNPDALFPAKRKVRILP